MKRAESAAREADGGLGANTVGGANRSDVRAGTGEARLEVRSTIRLANARVTGAGVARGEYYNKFESVIAVLSRTNVFLDSAKGF